MVANESHMCWRGGSLPDSRRLRRPQRGSLRTAEQRPGLADRQSVELPVFFSKKLFLLQIQKSLTGEYIHSIPLRCFVSRALFLPMDH